MQTTHSNQFHSHYHETRAGSGPMTKTEGRSSSAGMKERPKEQQEQPANQNTKL